MQMSSRIISVAIPMDMLPEIDAAARTQNRSRADIVREALRQYFLTGNRRIPVADAEPDEARAAMQGQAEFQRGEFIRLEDLQRELGLPTR
jgi:predicted transcriptional regulator